MTREEPFDVFIFTFSITPIVVHLLLINDFHRKCIMTEDINKNAKRKETIDKNKYFSIYFTPFTQIIP